MILWLLAAVFLAGCPNHYQKGMTYIEQGQTDLAIQELLAALQKEPNNPDIYYQLGQLYFQQDAYRKAQEMFQAVVDRFPAYANRDGAFYHLGACHFQFREYAPAMNAFAEVGSAFPASTFGELAQLYHAESAWFSEDIGKATGYYQELLRRFPTGAFYPVGLFRLGECHLTLGNHAEAADAFKKFLAAADSWKADAIQGRYDPNRLVERAYYGLGQGFVALKEPAKAIGYYRDLLNKFPKSAYAPEVFYRLGSAYESVGNQQQAIDTFRTLLKDFPASEFADDALFRQGSLQFSSGQHDLALASFAELLKMYPNSPNVQRAQIMTGNALMMKNEPMKAADAYEQALAYAQQAVDIGSVSIERTEPTAALRRQIRLSAAIAYYQADEFGKAAELLADIPAAERSTEEQFWSGEIAFRLQDYTQASDAFDRVLKSQDAGELLQQAHLGMLKILYAREQWQEMLQRTQEIPRERLTPEVFLLAGDAALNLKDFPAAIQWYEDIRNRYPQHPMAQDILYYAGIAAYKLEKFEQARRYFSDMIQQYPGHRFASDAQFYLGWTFFRDDNYDQAIRAFQLLIERFPKSEFVVQARLKIADCYFNMGRYAESLQEYQQIMNDYHDQPEVVGEAQYGLALVYKVTGEYDQYLAATREFIEKNPDSPLSIAAQFQIGEQYFQQEDYLNAINAYQWIVERFPDSEYADNALYRMGQSSAQQNDVTTALEYFHSLMSRYPKSEYRPATQYEIAAIYFRAQDFANAAVEYQTFLQSFPADSNVPQAMSDYGTSLIALNRMSEAAKLFEQLVQRFPTSPQAEGAGFVVGETYASQQRCEDAEEAFGAALNGADQAKAAKAQLTIAACYQAQGNAEKAIAEYFKVIYVHSSQKAEVDQATFASASIYEQQGKIDEARNLYKKLAETSANQEFVQQAKQKLQELQ